MRIGKLNAILRKAHENEAAARGQHGRQLENELLTRYRRQRGREWFFMLKPQSVTARVTLAVVVMVALGVGACSTPTDTEVPMGKQVSFGLHTEGEHGENSFTHDFTFDLSKEALDRLKAMPGVEDININETVQNGERRMDVLVWGEDVAGDKVLEFLKQEMDTPENTFVEVKDLNGTLHENWMSKIGREFFHIELDEGLSDEEMKAEIIAQLEAEGFEAGEVSVISDGDQKAIFISGTQETPEGVHEIEDEMKFEWVSEEEAGDDGESENQ